MKDLKLNTNEPEKAEQNWTSKKELMNNLQISSDTIEQIINDLNCDSTVLIQSHIKKGGYHNSEVFYDGYLVKLIQAKLLSNQANQGKTSNTIKSIVKDAVKNELTKTLSKDEIKLELARAKELIEQYKKQRDIIIKQNTAKLKEIELELLHQKEISKALETKNFTEPIKQEIMSMLLELAKQAIQEEYTNKLKQLDDYGNIQYDY